MSISNNQVRYNFKRISVRAFIFELYKDRHEKKFHEHCDRCLNIAKRVAQRLEKHLDIEHPNELTNLSNRQNLKL